MLILYAPQSLLVEIIGFLLHSKREKRHIASSHLLVSHKKIEFFGMYNPNDEQRSTKRKIKI